ncbi:MAG: Plug domain-containing protein [Kiloniellales bacterium]|nr:Plug domain-containing protein [Kiloniellales bacterium]
MQVVPRAVIDDQNARSAAEALENVSGVEVPERQEGLLSTFFIRGFEADLYIDGSPVFGQTNVVDSNTLVNVERIEVIKGPSATLFGGGTGAPLGGLINVVPKSPQFENAYTF